VGNLDTFLNVQPHPYLVDILCVHVADRACILCEYRWEELCKLAEGRSATQAMLKAATEPTALWDMDQTVLEEEEEREALLIQGPRGHEDGE
jgi:hypothetical protein